jgi:homoserine O-acetyltransferase
MGAAETSGRERFDLGDFPLESGEVLQGAFLIYRMLGRLSPARDNCILLPSYYSGTDTSYDPIIGPGRALDPERYFIVLTNMFGNGVSASPSTMTNSCAGAGFPKVTIRDNAAAQHRLLSEQFGISKLKLAFLEGVSAALRADAAYEGGRYSAPPETGLRAFGRVYAGWAYSAEFFRERLYEGLGYADLEAFLKGWEDDHLEHHATDLLAVLHAWRHADTGKALADITARTVLMPCDTDTYFTVRETELEAAEIGHAEVKVLHSPYGHCAGAPGRFDTEAREIETEMQRILSD